MVSLLLAAISMRNNGHCRDYVILFTGGEDRHFLDRPELEALLKKAAGSGIRNRPVSGFNLHKMEQALERHVWIRDAELYFDKKDVLHVTITEAIPVARVFTESGETFYFDRLGNRIPLSEDRHAVVPVFTGLRTGKKLTVRDSLHIREITDLAEFIGKDPFWKAQVAQVVITGERSFELIPVVGHHTVMMGDGQHIAEKFRRLMIFYQQVLGKTGMDRYETINVQFTGQVVAAKSAEAKKVQPAEHRKNMEKLIRESAKAAQETGVKTDIRKGNFDLPADAATLPDPVLTDKAIPAPGQENREPAGKKEQPKTGEKKDEKRVPKAVMPKRDPGAGKQEGDDDGSF